MNADGNKLFGVTGGSTGLTLNGAGTTLRVETINGWFYQDLAQADLDRCIRLRYR